MQFTGQVFKYDFDRGIKNLSKQMEEQLAVGLLGGYATDHEVTELEEDSSIIQYNTFNNIYRQNMRIFFDNVIKYRINDTPSRPGSYVKGSKGVLKGRRDTDENKGYLFGTDMRAGNLQFTNGILAVANNGCRVKRNSFGLALGSHTTVKGMNAFCAGKGSVARQPNQFVIGRYNVNYTNTIFEIGYGESNKERKTIFLIDKYGNVSAAGRISHDVPMLGSEETIDDSTEEKRRQEKAEYQKAKDEMERRKETASFNVLGDIALGIGTAMTAPLKIGASIARKLKFW